MDLGIGLEDKLTQHLSPQAQKALQKLTKEYAQGLVLEASRLEASSHTHEGNPEITAKNISDAAIFFRGLPQSATRSWPFVVLQVGAVLAALLVGSMFDLQALQADPAALYLFLVVLSLAVVLNSVEIVIGRPQ